MFAVRPMVRSQIVPVKTPEVNLLMDQFQRSDRMNELNPERGDDH